MTNIISISIPQTDDDQDIVDSITSVMAHYKYKELDITIEYETNSIRYRFERDEDG
jgi:hypothetical protein